MFRRSNSLHTAPEARRKKNHGFFPCGDMLIICNWRLVSDKDCAHGNGCVYQDKELICEMSVTDADWLVNTCHYC